MGTDRRDGKRKNRALQLKKCLTPRESSAIITMLWRCNSVGQSSRFIPDLSSVRIGSPLPFRKAREFGLFSYSAFCKNNPFLCFLHFFCLCKRGQALFGLDRRQHIGLFHCRKVRQLDRLKSVKRRSETRNTLAPWRFILLGNTKKQSQRLQLLMDIKTARRRLRSVKRRSFITGSAATTAAM